MLSSIKTANLTGSISRNAGGLFQSVRRLVQTLDDRGLKVCVFGTADEFTDQDIASWTPVEVRAFRPLWPKQFGYSPEFQAELERFAPDLTHTHGIWVYPSIATNRYSRRRGVPYMISPHGMLDPWAIHNSRWKKVFGYLLYENAHLHQANCIRALCESEARAIRACGLKNPIAIIPNGIDLPQISAEQGAKSRESGSERHLALCASPLAALRAQGRKVMLFLSRIHPKKGLPNLIRAWKQVQGGSGSTLGSSRFAPGASDWILAIAGWDQGGHEAELKRLCDELGIKWADIREATDPSGPVVPLSRGPVVSTSPHVGEASVFFIGPQFGEAKDIAYQNCDAFVLPSFSEGVPMVVLEAWAYCKPAVITPGCNLPDAFPRGAALRIDTDPIDIARGLREFFALSDSARAAMGMAGRKWMEERYTWPHLGRELADVYEWLLGSGPAPSCLADF